MHVLVVDNRMFTRVRGNTSNQNHKDHHDNLFVYGIHGSYFSKERLLEKLYHIDLMFCHVILSDESEMLMAQQMKLILFGLVIAVLAIAIVAAAIPQSVEAQKAGQGAGGGGGEGYQQGYTDGINAARQTYMAGKSYDPTCGFNHSDSYCLGYKAGYLLEWGKMIVLH